jgi:restriction system protein
LSAADAHQRQPDNKGGTVARRQKDDFEELMDLLGDSPWWVSVVVGLTVFVVTRFLVPAIWPDTGTISGPIAKLVSSYAWFSVIFVVPALTSLARSASKRRLLDRQSGIDSIRALTWKQFEELLGEAYRRQGFSVIENSGLGADGGIDLTISRGGATYLVQCKH